MDTITAIHTGRSIRDYERRAVEREIIADILWDAAQAPTTPVSGPLLFHVIEGVPRIEDFAGSSASRPRLVSGIPVIRSKMPGQTAVRSESRRRLTPNARAGRRHPGCDQYAAGRASLRDAWR
jgi:hypothetical protein